MVFASGIEQTLDGARARVRRALDSGEALERFRQSVEIQGGNPKVCDEPTEILDLTAKAVKIESRHAGFVTAIDTFEIGNAVAALGGGRIRMEDKIDPAVGFATEVKIGDKVAPGDVLGFVYCRESASAKSAQDRMQAAYSVDEAPLSNALELIKEVIEA
jgi:thymidine phosphorylase